MACPFALRAGGGRLCVALRWDRKAHPLTGCVTSGGRLNRVEPTEGRPTGRVSDLDAGQTGTGKAGRSVARLALALLA